MLIYIFSELFLQGHYNIIFMLTFDFDRQYFSIQTSGAQRIIICILIIRVSDGPVEKICIAKQYFYAL
jgi:hypothetical protein